MKNLSLNLRIKIIYFLYYGAISCYFAFLPVILINKNIPIYQRGLILSMNSIIGVFFQPIWGFVCDKYFNKKAVILGTMLATCVVIQLFVHSNSVPALLLAAILFNIIYCGIGPILDAYCYDMISVEKKMEFSKVRLMGSIGYAIVSILMGFVVKFIGTNSVFYFYGLIMLGGWLVLYTISFKGHSSRNNMNVGDLRVILKNNNFIIFLASVFIINSCMGSNGNFLSDLIKSTGGSDDKIGILWFVVAISELPILFIGSKLLKRYGEWKLYIFGLFLYSVRFMLSSLCSNYVLVIAVQAFQSVTFAIYILSAYDFVNELAPAAMRASAFTIFTAVASFGSFTGVILSGKVIEILNIFYLYRLISVVALIACGIAFFKKPLGKAQKIKS